MRYNPHDNGVAEIMNREILNMVHSMMSFKNVKLMFWVDAVLCAVYIKSFLKSTFSSFFIISMKSSFTIKSIFIKI